jgi:hypothetical protein
MLELLPMKDRQFDSKFYGKFRRAGVVEVTLEFARVCNFDAIDVMWTYCGKETVPERLRVLSNIPETVYPYYYRYVSFMHCKSCFYKILIKRSFFFPVHQFHE